MLLKDKVAVIAGDAYGIGEAAAVLFMREGARVLLIDDREDRQQSRFCEINGHRFSYCHVNLTRSNELPLAVEVCESLFSQVDVLFNVAGLAVKSTFENTSESTWTEMLGRNLTSVFLSSQYFLPLLKKSSGACIINHASIDAFLGNPSIAAYSAAKGGVLPLTHVMAHDLGPYGIRVNAISTGGIRAPEAPLSTRDHARMAVTPMKRMGTALDVARVALFLASDLSSYVNGTHVVVDGGRTATTHGCYED
jgi:NAD(P)-dependent dehydrogenase (short-subunit alcohol dehydrogenase family)